jgi:FHS family glucose/mannose:H+ symporter-like MFS transporter
MAAADASAPMSNRRLILLAQLAFVPTGVLTTLLGPMLAILIRRWSLSDTQAGNLFMVQFMGQLAGVQLSAFLLARKGFRPAFLAGLLLMAAGVSLIYTGGPWLGLVSVAVYGVGLGLIIPTDNLLVAEISHHKKSSAVSLLNFFWGVGAVACALLVAWSHVHGLLSLFLGFVALSLVVLFLMSGSLPFPGAVTTKEHAADWGKVWRSPASWMFAAIFFIYPGIETAVGGWVGSYVSRMSAREAYMASMMPAFFWFAMMVGRGPGSLLLPYLSERRVLQVGFASASVGIGLLLWSTTLPGVVGGTLLTGLSYATLYPITVARFSHRFGVAARSVGSVMFSLAAIGPAMIPWLVGVISQATGNLRVGLEVPLVGTVFLLLIHLWDW